MDVIFVVFLAQGSPWGRHYMDQESGEDAVLEDDEM